MEASSCSLADGRPKNSRISLTTPSCSLQWITYQPQCISSYKNPGPGAHLQKKRLPFGDICWTGLTFSLQRCTEQWETESGLTKTIGLPATAMKTVIYFHYMQQSGERTHHYILALFLVPSLQCNNTNKRELWTGKQTLTYSKSIWTHDLLFLYCHTNYLTELWNNWCRWGEQETES